MTITHIIHGGQTGVDRGAHMAAMSLGLKPTGYRPAGGQDEKGMIPADVADHLIPLEYGDYTARTRANVNLTRQNRGALLIVVPNRLRWADTPGTRYTVEYADAKVPCLVVTDDEQDAEAVRNWLARLPYTPHHLMVAGPRESKWAGATIDTRNFLVSLLG